MLLLPLAAAGALVAFFDPAGQVPRIEQAVRRATGREAHLRGVQIAWSLTPTLSLDGLTLANAPGSEPVMLDVPHAEVRVALLPLLSRRVEITRVSLSSPRLLLETDASGRGNWLFSRPAPDGDAPSAPGQAGARFVPELRRVEASDGIVRLRDGATGRSLDIALPRLQLDATGSEASLSADAVASGLALTVQAKGGPLSRFLGGAASAAPSAWPLAVQVQGSGIQASATGVLPDVPRFGGAAFALDARVADLSVLMPRLPLREVTLAARWSPSGLSDIVARAGQSDLSWLLPGLSLRGAALTAPAAGQPARAELDGMLDGAQVTASASVLPRPEGQGAVLRGIGIVGPFGDLAGDAAVSWAPHPALRGTLVSRRFDLDAVQALRSRLPAQTSAPAASAAPAPAAPGPAPDRVIPDTALPFGLLRAADVDLRWLAASVRLGGADWQGLEMRAALGDGRLRLDPFTVASPGGRLEAELLADAGRPEPSIQLKLRLPGIAVAPLAALLGRPDAATGTAQGEADLRASGPTPRALAASLDGTAALTLVDGDLDAAVAFPALLNLLRSAGIPATLRGRGAVRCVALSVAAQHGAVQLRTAYLDSSRLRLSAEGGVNLADETLALRLRPALRLGPTDAAVPLRLEGTFARPKPQLDQVVPGRVGAVIGAQRAQGDECGPALLAARGGREGPMPVPEQPSSGNPADVLRRLLR